MCKQGGAVLLCARFKRWEAVGEKMGSAEVESDDGETVMRDQSASVATLSSESSPAVGHQEWQMLICESSIYSVGFYKCTYCSQVTVLISTKFQRKEKLPIMPSLPHIALVLFIIIILYLLLLYWSNFFHFCFSNKKKKPPDQIIHYSAYILGFVT